MEIRIDAPDFILHDDNIDYEETGSLDMRNMDRRSRLEIYFDLLKIIERGTVKPTRIMYKANLSWDTMQEIFGILLESGFIQEEIVANSKRYAVTDKGRSALSYYLKSVDELAEVKQLISR